MSNRWLLGFVGGVVVAVGFLIACSDDAPSDADAAVCDCPAAEPPLTGRIVTMSRDIAITAGTADGGSASCPAGATVLGGGCGLMIPDDRIVLSVAKPARSGDTQGYVCTWSGLQATANNTGTVEAICLVPAQ